MIVLGLTGSIASGKSEAARRFAHHGIPVFDADKTVHDLYRQAEVADQVKARFPDAVFDGQVDRSRLAEHLVKAPDDFPVLEAIVHPLVRAEMHKFLQNQKDQGVDIAVVDVPLLLETGASHAADRIILVTVDPHIQLRRALARPGMTEAKLDAILAHQLPTALKAVRADHIVENSGTLDELAAKIDQLVYDLQAEHGEKAE
jgi:dephospho-CoA kinase